MVSMKRKETYYIIKKHIKENVYRTVKIEFLNISQQEVDLILDNKSDNTLDIGKDIIDSVCNIYNAYDYIYQNLDEGISVEKILELHKIITEHQVIESGVIRNGCVSIKGVEYLPPNPKDVDLEQIFYNQVEILINKSEHHPIEAAIDYFLEACHNQFFWDGNKRTAFMVANYVLLQSGNGLLGIDERSKEMYLNLMKNYYETGRKKKIATFLYNDCLDTFGFKINDDFDAKYFKQQRKPK